MVFAIICNMQIYMQCTDPIDLINRDSEYFSQDSVIYYLSGLQEWIKTKTDDTATFSDRPFLCNYSYNSDKGCGGC